MQKFVHITGISYTIIHNYVQTSLCYKKGMKQLNEKITKWGYRDGVIRKGDKIRMGMSD